MRATLRLAYWNPLLQQSEAERVEDEKASEPIERLMAKAVFNAASSALLELARQR
jgi:hypothetical protein